ncbi:MAG: type II toxin-antitoxin system RelE/ParE family toxin [Treponema sp.]|jgi:plasmid stabilization system protein ParE|nr:type II toxin-antitoxin system RelE/ParE family toxin [Treponema sp.]
MYRLIFSKLYKEDVDSSYNYIKDKLESPMAADNLIKEILEKLNKIKENPGIRPLVQDKYLASLGYRSISVKNYTIFYIISSNNLYIIRFLYKKRNWINILKEKTI